ncbi:MAG: DUF4250 domain-containing protein, partial [Eubacteriales bacterium]|nr:DUF4250 domain-containing protein [Eubacteriales bacterium]
LMSYLNTKLRDSYNSLDELAKSEDADINEILSVMKSIGFSYNEDTNSFTR